MCTPFAVPLHFSVTANAQGIVGANIDTVPTMVAETHRVGVMAGLALKITALEEDYKAVSRAVDA